MKPIKGDARQKALQYIQYQIRNLRRELVEKSDASQLLTDRDLSMYESLEYMIKKNVSTIEELADHVRIESLARYCVDKQNYFSNMEAFFLAVNGFYARLAQSLEEEGLDESRLSG